MLGPYKVNLQATVDRYEYSMYCVVEMHFIATMTELLNEISVMHVALQQRV